MKQHVYTSSFSNNFPKKKNKKGEEKDIRLCVLCTHRTASKCKLCYRAKKEHSGIGKEQKKSVFICTIEKHTQTHTHTLVGGARREQNHLRFFLWIFAWNYNVYQENRKTKKKKKKECVAFAHKFVQLVHPLNYPFVLSSFCLHALHARIPEYTYCTICCRIEQ